jgi:transcriptional regulator with XRE-family HTH domain
MHGENDTFSPVATGARVREMRQANRYSQAGLADAMRGHGFSWHQNTVFRVETGRRRLSLEEGAALAAIFTVPLVSLGRAS